MNAPQINNKENSPKKTSKKIKVKKAHFVDQPNKPEIPSPYLRDLKHLYETRKKFALHEFQQIRKTSNRKDIIDSFQRIGKVLNDVDPSELPKNEIRKVCFIVVNSTINDIDYCGTGPFNDAYTIAKLHQHLKYEIFLLYNSNADVFLQFFQYFLTYTSKYLTFYYSGRDAITVGVHGLYFLDNSKVFHDDLAKFVCDNCNGKSRILILSDCISGGTIFDMSVVSYRKKSRPKKLSKILVFTINKELLKKREKSLSHGLFTYCFCRLIKNNPRATPLDQVDLLNLECKRFKETFDVECSAKDLYNTTLFKGASRAFKVKVVRNTNSFIY